MTWQPIETAPKDGSDCIFFTPQYGGKQIISFLYPDGQPWLEMGHNHVTQPTGCHYQTHLKESKT
jgi:hypothetical protein